MKLYLMLTTLASILWGCGMNTVDKQKEESVEFSSPLLKAAEDKKREENKRKVIQILRYLPSPTEVVEIVDGNAIDFNDQILHDRSRAADYLLNSQRALNLGIYGADLGYIRVHNKTQYIGSYLAVIRQLAEDLGIPNSFTESTYNKIDNQYQTQKQGLEMLIDAYESTESYLQSNDRNQTSALLITGGWIEGIYIACHTASGKQNLATMRKIAEQKYTLEKIIELLLSVERNTTVDAVLSNMQLLKAKFSHISLNYVNEDLSIDSLAYENYQHKYPNWTLSEGEFQEIHNTVTSLRNLAIQ